MRRVRLERAESSRPVEGRPPEERVPGVERDPALSALPRRHKACHLDIHCVMSTAEGATGELEIGIAALRATAPFYAFCLLSATQQVVDERDLDHVRQGSGLLRQWQKMPTLGELVCQIGFVHSFQRPRMLARPLEGCYNVHLVIGALLSQPLQEVQ